MSATNEGQWGRERAGIGAASYQTACLRLPQFPLQVIWQERPEWRGKKLVCLPRLKADARIRYLSPEAAKAGVKLGGRYATVLGTVPDLLAATCSPEELEEKDSQFVELLRQFSPSIRRRSQHLERGLYLLDASGLGRAFGGMKKWAFELVRACREAGWEVRLALGFTAFATEMATYQLSQKRPVKIFQSPRQEEQKTLQTSLTHFSLPPEQVERLGRFHIHNLGDFLALDLEELKRRFGAELTEFYQKASQALFTSSAVLKEVEALMTERGFPDPIFDLQVILRTVKELLRELVPKLLAEEKAVSTARLKFLTEDNGLIEQSLHPTFPTADIDWLILLVGLRLEKYFQKYPLRWGRRVERVILELEGAIDPEKQGELFSDWALDISENESLELAPRDKKAALWALSQVRAEFGDAALVRAQILDHHLPERDHAWRRDKEELDWLCLPKKAEPSPDDDAVDRRVRRILYEPLHLRERSDWNHQYGPYSLSGDWWSNTSYCRDYYFCQKDKQTAWLYKDLDRKRWRVQGWFQ